MHNKAQPQAPADVQTETVPFERLQQAASRLLAHEALPEIAKECGRACAFLEACGYPGLKLLFEAVDTTPRQKRHPELAPDALGLDLHNVSCVFLAPRISAMVEERGRLFLRNVVHGLYLVPFSVWSRVGIGCPVDPAFALGGERAKNPYEEKLAAAKQTGIVVAHHLWRRAAATIG